MDGGLVASRAIDAATKGHRVAKVMNHSWLNQVRKDSLTGKQVIILECSHVDIRPGQMGVVEGPLGEGYKVKTTGIFARDIQNCQQETRTETVWVATGKLQVVEIQPDAQI